MQQLRKDIGIAMACRALDVPRATYDRRLSDRCLMASNRHGA